MTILLCLIFAGTGAYFSNATVYDPVAHGLREGVFVLIDGNGMVARVADAPIPVHEDTPRFDRHMLLPHFSDFYTLIQERGLGADEDVDMTNQAKLARYLCRIGIDRLRDPVFPAIGLSALMVDTLQVTAARGYLDLADGPGAAFCNLMDPEKDLPTNLAMLPDKGPVTLWWTSQGSGIDPPWLARRDFTLALIEALRARGQLVGAYIQDAGVPEISNLTTYPFDFYEGLPAVTFDVATWPDVVWVPLAALNDKRYCAVDLGDRLRALEGLGLYSEPERAQALKAEDSIRDRISARCRVWRERRAGALEPLRQWLARGGKVGLGSAGGHSFCFSGDLKTELTVLEECGADQHQLLRAAFETTPALLGGPAPYLVEGRAADLIAYPRDGYWGSLVGTRVAFNYTKGKNLLEPSAGLPVEVPQGQAP